MEGMLLVLLVESLPGWKPRSVMYTGHVGTLDVETRLICLVWLLLGVI